MTRKQKIEMFFAEPILKHLGIMGEVYNSDSPDLRYCADGRRVGIEVTGCYPDEGEASSFNLMQNRVYDV